MIEIYKNLSRGLWKEINQEVSCRHSDNVLKEKEQRIENKHIIKVKRTEFRHQVSVGQYPCFCIRNQVDGPTIVQEGIRDRGEYITLVFFITSKLENVLRSILIRSSCKANSTRGTIASVSLKKVCIFSFQTPKSTRGQDQRYLFPCLSSTSKP